MTRVLLIGGTDSSGGAGLMRDGAVTFDFDCVPLPIVTAVTAQTDQAVHCVHLVPPEIVVTQLKTAFVGDPPDAVKIGMVGTRECAQAVASVLMNYRIPIVLDPVLHASSGTALYAGGNLGPLTKIATLLTPNLNEAAALLNRHPASGDDAIADQARVLRAGGVNAVLMKGGHSQDHECTDHLFDAGGHHRITGRRQPMTRRGTGCTLATAIACRLGAHRQLADACRDAFDYTKTWISAGQLP